MSGVEAGIVGFLALLVLMVIRIPIGVAMITASKSLRSAYIAR